MSHDPDAQDPLDHQDQRWLTREQLERARSGTFQPSLVIDPSVTWPLAETERPEH